MSQHGLSSSVCFHEYTEHVTISRYLSIQWGLQSTSRNCVTVQHPASDPSVPMIRYLDLKIIQQERLHRLSDFNRRLSDYT